MSRVVVLDECKLRRLREYLEREPTIKFAAIVGSVATRGYSYHDIDIVVKMESHNKYEQIMRVVDDVARLLGVDPEAIDIVDIDRADLEFRKRVLETGIVLVDRGFLNELMREIMQSYPEYYEYQVLSIREWLSSQDPTDVDVNIVKRRLDFIKSELEFLEQYVLSRSVDEVKTSPVLKRLLERGYQLVVEAVIDTCRHIVSARGWGPAYKAADFVDKCYEHGVVSSEVRDYFVRAIKLRNIIVHRYLDIDYDLLYEEARKLVRYAREFERQIVDYLRRLGKEVT